MSEDNLQANNFIKGLITGAVIGTGLVWFLNSTDKGKEIKKEIKDKSEDVLDNLSDLVQDFEEKGQEFKEKVIQVKKDFEEKAKDFRQDIIEEGKMGLDRVEELEEKSHKAAQKFFTRKGKSLS
ncbi:MAG: YtxH domain-containing protein [Candidatus Shapirobacteria bacterium]|nr:YtxH domain-containing protein [Candidatus Shapirobacteria bacterium]